jgi:hypothetical protein
MKELKRMTAMGNNTGGCSLSSVDSLMLIMLDFIGISRANGELDTIAKHLTKASAGSTLACVTCAGELPISRLIDLVFD